MPKSHDWRQWERIRASIFERAYALYQQRRSELQAEFEATYLPEMPDDYQQRGKKLLAEWLAKWDEPKAIRNRKVAAELNPRQQLEQLAAQQQANRERLDKLLESVKDTDPTYVEAQTMRTYITTSETLQRQMDAIASKLDAQAQWADESQDWFIRKATIKRKIFRDYKGKGQVYDMLCDRLASLQVGLEWEERSGGIGSDTYKNLNEQWVNCVTQIQRHTESIKVEDVSPLVQQVGEKFMRILEGELSLTQPALLVRLQNAIFDNVIEGRFEQGQKVKLLEAGKEEALIA